MQIQWPPTKTMAAFSSRHERSISELLWLDGKNKEPSYASPFVGPIQHEHLQAQRRCLDGAVHMRISRSAQGLVQRKG